jgi:DNA repair exonuclease SbcCD ATPase subunit
MIRRLCLVNAGPYKGIHELELGPKAYAITARHESDAGRSNFSGKSFLLEMIDFALTGRLAKFRRYDADGWISRGEREGRVMLELEDGSTILRERKRGQPTQVRFGGVDRGKGAAQEDASFAVLKHLGFDADDFRNVAYFEQKQMARLVLTEPEKRMEIVRGWLGLGKCDLAEEKVGDIANERASELERLRAQHAALVTVMGKRPAEYNYTLAKAQEDALGVQLRAVEDEQRWTSRLVGEAAAHQRTVDEYDALVAQGKALAAEAKGLDPELLEAAAKGARARWETSNGVLTAAARDAKAKHKVSLGLFDGRCPVAELACPATERINADRTASKKAHEKALGAEHKARDLEGVAHREMRDAERALEAARSMLERLTKMRTRASELGAEAKDARAWLDGYAPLDFEQLSARRHELQEKLSAVRAATAVAREGDEKWATQEARLTELDEQIARAQREFAVASKARSVFRATQRRVAERALGAINRQASTMLADGGIPLGVELRWEREGKDPAKQCEECGAAFPKSARVKECARCGAARGLQVVQKLEFLPSDRSGGADDIAGVVLQLAAGAWFLRSRASCWATALMDEPAAALDKSNRRALTMQLVKLLSTGAWRQALVISHSSDMVDLYPGRIEIIVGKDGSRRIVQT